MVVGPETAISCANGCVGTGSVTRVLPVVQSETAVVGIGLSLLVD